MKKLMLSMLLFIIIIPIYVNAKENEISFYSNYLHLNYIDENGNFKKDVSFEVRNISDTKVVSLLDYGSGLYSIPMSFNNVHQDSELYEKALSFFDDYHQNIIRELLSDSKYIDANTFNAYISDLETDDIFYLISKAKYGYDGWGIRGRLPIKIVEIDNDIPIVLYNHIDFSLSKYNGIFGLDFTVWGNPHYISNDDDIIEIHKQRFAEDLNNNTYSLYLEPSEEFKSRYPMVKSYKYYNKECLAGPSEGEPLQVNHCGISTIYNAKQNKYIIKTKTDGNGAIEVINKASGGESIQFKVTAKKGLKLTRLTITTDSGEKVEFNEEDITTDSSGVFSVSTNKFTMPYENVTIEARWSSSIINPKTGTGISIIIITTLLLVSSTTYMIFKRKKNYITK